MLLKWLLIHIHGRVCLEKLLCWLLEGPWLRKTYWVLILWRVHFRCVLLALLRCLFCGACCCLGLLNVVGLRFLELQILILLLLIHLLIYQCWLPIIVELTWAHYSLLLLLELVWLEILVIELLGRDHHLWHLVLVRLVLHGQVLLLEHLSHVSLDCLLVLYLRNLLLYLGLMLLLHHLWRLVDYLRLTLRLITTKLVSGLNDIEVHSHLLLLGIVLRRWVLHAPTLPLFTRQNFRLLLYVSLCSRFLHSALSLERTRYILSVLVLLMWLIKLHRPTWSLESWPLIIVVLGSVADLLLAIVECLLLDRLRLEESIRSSDTSSVV